MIITPKEVEVEIEKIVKETKDTVSLYFKTEKSTEFYPGQFLTIDTKQFDKLNNTDIGRKSGPRAYSILWPFGITVKKEDNGLFSTFCVDGGLKVGDKFKVKSPFGHFIYLEGNVVLIGAGSGFVPVYTITKYIAEKNLPVEVKFFGSNKTHEDIIYRKDLEELNKLPNIKVFQTITRPEGSEWAGRTGRIDKKFLEQNIDDFSKYAFFICGPTKFVDAIVLILQEKNVGKERIRLEKYG